MTAATDSKEVSLPFGAAGVDDFTSVDSGAVYGDQAASLDSNDFTDFNSAIADIKRRAEAARNIGVTANWTEVPCQAPGAGAQGALQADRGCTVILSGTKAGAGTILPAPGAKQGAQSKPETPAKPISEPGTHMVADAVAEGSAEPAAAVFHKVGREDGLLIIPGRGVYGAKALLANKAAETKHTELPVLVPPLLDLNDNPPVLVAEQAGGPCKTFGANPQVLVAPPARFHVSAAAVVKTIVVAISLTVEITPVRASFGRTGLCWQGICSTEQITGLVMSTVRVHFTVRATGAIKIGKWTIGGGNIVFTTDISVPRQTNYTLTTG